MVYIYVSYPLPMPFRYQMEKQVLGEVDGNPACGNAECHASEVGFSLHPFGLLTAFQNQKWAFETLTGVSNLLASLGHTGRRVVLDHTLNTQTLMKTDEQRRGFK